MSGCLFAGGLLSGAFALGGLLSLGFCLGVPGFLSGLLTGCRNKRDAMTFHQIKAICINHMVERILALSGTDFREFCVL